MPGNARLGKRFIAPTQGKVPQKQTARPGFRFANVPVRVRVKGWGKSPPRAPAMAAVKVNPIGSKTE